MAWALEERKKKREERKPFPSRAAAATRGQSPTFFAFRSSVFGLCFSHLPITLTLQKPICVYTPLSSPSLTRGLRRQLSDLAIALTPTA